MDIYAIYDGEETFQHGDTVYISGQILPLNGKSIPGGFDEKLYLQTKGVDYKIYPDSLVKVGETNSMAVALQRQKEKVFDVFDTVLPQTESGIVKAMVTGEKDAINQETWDLYVKAGINHILCVSGVKTLYLVSPLSLESGLKWAFVRVHNAKKYIQNLCFKGQYLARCPPRFCGGKNPLLQFDKRLYLFAEV